MNINGTKLMAVELFTINAFFIGFPHHDLAYVLACSASVICGFGGRIVILLNDKDNKITKNVIALHAAATIIISYVAYQAWLQIFHNVALFMFFGIQLYLILCSFLSVFIIQQLDKMGRMSIKTALRGIFNKYLASDETISEAKKQEDIK